MALFTFITTLFSKNNKTSDSQLNRAVKPASKQSVHKSDISWHEKAYYHELEQTYYQYLIGVNSLLELELNEFEQQVLMLLGNSLQENNQSLAEQIPRLPVITPKLIHLLRGDDFNWKEVAQLTAQDPVLLVEIIKLANSSRFNLQASDDKLEHILMQLGLLEVRKVIMKTALKPIMLFTGGHFIKHSGSKIWVHSIKTAEVCQLLAQQQKLDPFEAYLGGLLHNLGMTIVIKKMDSIKDFNQVPCSIHFMQQILSISRRFSVLISQSWEINSRVVQAIADQSEQPEQIKSPLGQLLNQAVTISMQHTLEENHRWKKDSVLNDSEGMNYNQIKNELDLLKF